jgi:hypothetical protein
VFSGFDPSAAVCHSELFRAQHLIFRRSERHRLSVGGIASMPDICSAIWTPLLSCRVSWLVKAVAVETTTWSHPLDFQKKQSRTACRCSLIVGGPSWSLRRCASEACRYAPSQETFVCQHRGWCPAITDTRPERGIPAATQDHVIRLRQSSI